MKIDFHFSYASFLFKSSGIAEQNESMIGIVISEFRNMLSDAHCIFDKCHGVRIIGQEEAHADKAAFRGIFLKHALYFRFDCFITDIFSARQAVGIISADYDNFIAIPAQDGFDIIGRLSCFPCHCTFINIIRDQNLAVAAAVLAGENAIGLDASLNFLWKGLIRSR